MAEESYGPARDFTRFVLVDLRKSKRGLDIESAEECCWVDWGTIKHDDKVMGKRRASRIVVLGDIIVTFGVPCVI